LSQVNSEGHKTSRRFCFRAIRRILIIAVLPLVGSVACIPYPQATVSLPRLVLVVSIDQMRFDYLTRFAPLFKGGLKTLIDAGAVFTNARYRHASTETGPGHSVILSGRHPSHSGIVANEWYDSFLHRAVNVVDDPVQMPLGGSGRKASPVNALGYTIGDLLKLKDAQSKVIGVSLKDRSAILLAGRRADAAYWYETTGGNFITSTYYMPEAPRWLVAWNARRTADKYAGMAWNRLLDDIGLYERYAGPDAIEGEWDRKDTVFPHVVRNRPPAIEFYDDLRRTPFADEMTLGVALEAMNEHHLGEDASTDLFAVGFSATDIIGHTYGADSQEIMDQLLRLDVVLDKLMKAVDNHAGLANTLVVLTSDHGSTPLVENLQARGLEARRAARSVLETALQQAFEARFPGANLVEYYIAPDFYLNLDAIRTANLDRRTVERTAREALLSTGIVADVYSHEDIRNADSSDDLMVLYKNAFFEPRTPHLSVRLRQYTYLSDLTGGTGHGSPYEDDRHIPIVFMGSGVTPGRYELPCGPEDIAPTLARMLQLEMPAEPDSRLLLEMLGGS
jgi:predicted AlkP superfamily pyrophosphatase or phosphodiesterase